MKKHTQIIQNFSDSKSNPFFLITKNSQHKYQFAQGFTEAAVLQKIKLKGRLILIYRVEERETEYFQNQIGVDLLQVPEIGKHNILMNKQLLTPVFPAYCYAPEICKAESTDDEASQEETPVILRTNFCKYKTEMCKNFSENGYCPYEEKCQFAHGAHELMAAGCGSSQKRYQAKKCRSFWQKGVCGYGPRCQFSHTPNYEQSLGGLALRFLGQHATNEGSRLSQVLRKDFQ